MCRHVGNALSVAAWSSCDTVRMYVDCGLRKHGPQARPLKTAP